MNSGPRADALSSIIREYETLFVLNPELTDDAAKSVVDRLKEIIARMNGDLVREDGWGKRKMAFEVKKQARGNFFLFHYIAPPGVVEELERTMRNLDQVIRYLTTGRGDVKDITARKAEIHTAVQEEAAARAKRESERDRDRDHRDGIDEEDLDHMRERDRDRDEGYEDRRPRQ